MSRSTAVDFTLRANITDLKSELGKIPGITDKEAKKMASGLERQLLRSEKAAKKTAAAMRGDLGKSVDQAVEKFRNLSTAVGVSEESFDSFKSKAAEMAGSVEQFNDGIGQADSSLSAMAVAVHSVNPELAEMMRKGADAAGAVEAVINAARNGPAVFAALAAATVAAYVAQEHFTKASREYEEQNEKASKQQDKLHAQLRRQEEIGDTLSAQYDAQVLQLSETEQSYAAMNQRISQTVARLQKLARNTPNYGSIVEQTEDWAAEQFKLNKAIRDTTLAQERSAKSFRIMTAEAKIHESAQLGLFVAQRRLAESTKFANKEALKEGAQRSFLAAQAKTFAVQKQKQIRDQYEEAKSVDINTKALEMQGSQYFKHVQLIRQAAEDAEKATGKFYQVLDFSGNVVDFEENVGTLISGWNRTGRQVQDTGAFIQDMGTGEIMTLAQIVQKTQAADMARRESSKQRRAQLRAEKELADQAALAELDALAFEHAAAVDKQKLDAMTTEAKLDELERRALAELDAMQAGLESQELFSAEAQEKIEQARSDVQEKFEAERKRGAKEEADALVSIFEKAAQALQAQQIDSPLISDVGLEAMEKAGDTAAKLRQEFKAAGEDIPPLIEAQLQGLESMDQMAAAIPKFLSNYGQALAESQTQFDAVWSQMGAKIEEQAAHLGTFFSGVSEAAGVAADLMADKNRKAAMKAFRIQQGAAISEAVINGAVAISKVQGQLGVFSPFAIAGIVASTAAQVATIAAEQPAFDVGGVIGGSMAGTPDQVSIRALPGEAVLNRQAVDQLGESGVDRLNNGGSPGVVVRPVSTFKHFDRFARAEFRRSGYFRTLFDQDREFAVGQRRY